jgi:hypothetical protein
MAETRPNKLSCGIFLPGHTVHWIQGKKSAEPGQAEIPVSLVVHDDGLVDIEGNDLKLTPWNHSPRVLRQSVNSDSCRGRAWWRPQFHVLVGPSGRVFNMARLDERTPCRQPVRPRPGEPVADFLFRAGLEDGGCIIRGPDLVRRDAPRGSAKAGDDGTSTASSE